MVDFGRMMQRGNEGLPSNPVEIFDQLPKSNRISNLYKSQADILSRWYEVRSERDIIIELNTGGGKTLIGLLICMSMMRETRKGVIYLVENNQLVNQVVEQGGELGMPVSPYSKDALNADFDNGNLILVGAYQALFNGKSKFGIEGKGEYQPIGGVVIDDAHASLDTVRDAFSVRVSAEKSVCLYQKLLSLFRSAFEKMELANTFHEFYDGEAGSANDTYVEIPFWEWQKLQPSVSDALLDSGLRGEEDRQLESDLTFSWPLLKDRLKYCQVVVSKRGIVISALYPMVDLFPSFAKASHRVFMSATITDYGDMVRTYDLRQIGENAVIAPNTSAGVGRRMILPLETNIAASSQFSSLIEERVHAGQGVVRLAPRFEGKTDWCGVDMVSPRGHEEVANVVKLLKSNRCSKVVSFANRYNGTDLPGDSCRVLVVSGLPKGNGDVDGLLARYLSDSNVNTHRIAQRIEQGLGRGVRSGSDHCVILLEGDDLIDWMRRNVNRAFFSPALQSQLQMGDAIFDDIRTPDDYCDAIIQDVDSDPNWKAFHSQELSRGIKTKLDVDVRFGVSFKVACAERKAFSCWRNRDADKGSKHLQNFIGSTETDDQLHGWLLQFAGRIKYDGSEQNAVAADAIQRKAHSYNRAIPYYGFIASSITEDWAVNQAEALLKALDDREMDRGAPEAFDRNTSSLVHKAPAHEFEQALMFLGKYLGFESKRHDKNGKGADVCWISTDNIGFVLEAKNEKELDVPFHKVEAGQLRTAGDWFRELHPGLKVIEVSVHPSQFADENASASNLQVLTLAKLEELKEKVRCLVEKASDCFPNRGDVLAAYIANENLSGRSIAESFFDSFSSR